MPDRRVYKLWLQINPKDSFSQDFLIFHMITQTIRNLVKKARKERETLEVFCSDCNMHQTFRGTFIRVKAMRKEFLRQHNHDISLKQKLFRFLQRR